MQIDTLPNVSIFRPHVHVGGCFVFDLISLISSYLDTWDFKNASLNLTTFVQLVFFYPKHIHQKADVHQDDQVQEAD